MPIHRKANRPNTSDPFKNPALGYLRGNDIAGVGETHDGGFSVAFDGDWMGLGSSEKGALKLLNAVKACFEAEGVKVREASLDKLPKDVQEKVSSSSTFRVKVKHVPTAEGIILESVDSGPYEFTMHFIFTESEKNRESANNAMEKIIANSEKIEAARQAGTAKKAKD